MKKILIIIFFILQFLVSYTAQCGGYQVSLHSHKNMGMGLIGTSLNEDASTVFLNPGAMGTLSSKYNFMAGISGIRSTTKFQLEKPSIYQAATDNPLSTPFYFYATAGINENLNVGLAVNTPFGNNLRWEEGWAGRYLIQEISLKAITIQPTIAYRLNESISIGIGFVVATGKVDLKRKLPVQNESVEGELNISGSAMNYGLNAGILFVPFTEMNIGLSYRSLIKMNLDKADANFSVPESLREFFPETNTVATSLPLPANLDLGISYRFSEKLMAGITLNYVFWSTYENLDFDFEINTMALNDVQSPREYSNTLILRTGAEYQVLENLFLRAGVFYDPSPVNEIYFSPETPGLNNIGLSTGLSFFPLENLSIDFSFLYIMGIEKDVSFIPANFNGAYKSRAYIPGLGVSYSF
jgi:long-chain fatty acid transport protein